MIGLRLAEGRGVEPMPLSPVPAICYDLAAVSRFFRSVALAVAFQQHTKTEWQVHHDNTVLNVIYAVMFWKSPPGIVEIRQPQAKIEKTTDELHQKYLIAWLRKLNEQGPVAANLYVTNMHRLRRDAEQFLAQALRDAGNLNAAVINETSDGIRKLALIRLVGSAGVAVLGAAGAIVLAPAGAVVVSGIGLGYSCITSTIKSWEQGGAAKAVGIEIGKAAAGERLGAIVQAREVKALNDQKKAAQVIRSAEGEIRKYSQRLAQEGLRKAQIAKAQNIVGRATAQVGRQTQVASQAARAAGHAGAAMKAIPLVFAAIGIWGAWSDYDETIKNL